MINKRLQLTVIGVAAAALLAGCSDNASTGETVAKPSAKGSDATQKETVVTLWGASDFLKGDESPGQRMIKEFNEQNKGRIRIEARYMAWSEYNTAIQAAATSHELPDIFQTPQNSDIRTLVADGWAKPFDGLVSDAWKQQFGEGAFVEGVNVIEGKTYSWPLTGPQLGAILYYNKDVLKNAGLDPEKPPTTWYELREDAKKVTASGKGDVYGIVFGGGETGSASGISKFVDALSAGISPEEAGGFDYKTGQYVYESKATVDSFGFLQQLKADGSILPSSYTLKATESSVLFGQGKAAFLIDGRARMWIVKRDTPEANFGLAQVPTPTGQKPTYFYVKADPSGYMISSASQHAKEAGEFIEKAFAAPPFYTKYLQSGVALTPLDSINQDTSLYPYPEFNTFLKLHKDLLKLRPDYAVRNPETAKVIVELGSLQQPKVKPGYSDILQSVLTGAEKDLPALLQAYDEKLNKGLADAVGKAKSEGAKVDITDFQFPNWDAGKDYTVDDYVKLK
ncbi:multiple sugar transport system substrate-binding protein [Paenibacillus sp. UNC496MF]|uniref:ABC transporter substrate-binding protein n=1 Tax=Paenibacillus sp. UNC496MF TaxID=1502753 RepID=UPI0008EB76D6|nr:extracellular solute-binding protein [Paenibacillus sp. UNC496MF]SFJ76507.1 multiple sugar transport system substrate-binding protein [Paenibacillus sp. UNC496MF]